jgi:UDP-glucose 4-epimerase
MNVILTGSSGRLGRVTSRALIAAGHTVTGLDRKAADEAGPDGLTFVEDGLDNLATLKERFQGHDGLIHLAAIPSPRSDPPEVVFANNAVTTFNVLQAAADCGVDKICLASSINAIGGAFSRKPRYDYFPVDEEHPTYSEDAYSLSKWVNERTADMFARRHERLTISSLRFHGLHKRVERSDPGLSEFPAYFRPAVVNHLWAYTDIESAAQACVAALTAAFTGHEVFYIVAPRTVFNPAVLSADLAQSHYPNVPVRRPFDANAGLFDCAKAARLLGWTHRDI